jgi:hypothetical protein
MKQRTTIILGILGIIFYFLLAQNASAQTWSQCADGSAIARCETFDCPNGDTNGDGECTLADQGARLTDARNDSFCANPISGCGQVHYYKATSSNRCAIRVKETGNNCNLYSVSTPNFTPVPSVTPRPTMSKSSPTSTPTATGSATTKGGLPETGPSLLTTVLLGAMGLFGIFLYERFRLN